mmetsp:Transcript_12511/g.18234  ORF Transcript_12511/g.18234 Transcript_12511/m.18234 type:complete len:124 (-) Transcript_12511:264-635(-)
MKLLREVKVTSQEVKKTMNINVVKMVPKIFPTEALELHTPMTLPLTLEGNHFPITEMHPGSTADWKYPSSAQSTMKIHGWEILVHPNKAISSRQVAAPMSEVETTSLSENLLQIDPLMNSPIA